MAVRDDPVAFAWELQSSGYATDPKYAQKLVSIMRQYMGVT
jgi:flagellum-specific peptidoglycan hydrolase FlgJ